MPGFAIPARPPLGSPLANPAANPTATAAMRRAAQAFEAQALGALLQPMFQGLETKPPFGGGAGEAQWRPMLIDAIARDFARRGGLGLGDAVLREMTRLAGAPTTSPPTERPEP
jgi:Rod binding domain-containing protein